MKIELRKTIDGTSYTCLNCAVDDSVLPMRTRIIAGFGSAVITKNDEVYYSAPMDLEWDKAKTLIIFEKAARKYPDADWRYELDLPLRSAIYQRHGKNKWCLIEKGLGFA
jgi:hypothetical protein